VIRESEDDAIIIENVAEQELSNTVGTDNLMLTPNLKKNERGKVSDKKNDNKNEKGKHNEIDTDRKQDNNLKERNEESELALHVKNSKALVNEQEDNFSHENLVGNDLDLKDLSPF